MPLNTPQLETDILNLLNAASQVNASTPLQRRQAIAAGLATAFEAFVKSGDGKYQGNLIAGPNSVTAVIPAGTVIKIE
jgi:hypothetical protein